MKISKDTNMKMSDLKACKDEIIIAHSFILFRTPRGWIAKMRKRESIVVPVPRFHRGLGTIWS
ncbi:hypothetical protein [uncultured Campylobacter sp.]|uniref:hypothetical protein n=1 Tax=uncultured Campylobacter sp. TaxID=218934 RepID=UPI0026185A42|nr:hypothetical protein [uncultured Campylobacter sp.]